MSTTKFPFETPSVLQTSKGTSEEIETLVRGFDIVDEARFTAVGKPSFEASRLDFALAENARCVCEF